MTVEEDDERATEPMRSVVDGSAMERRRYVPSGHGVWVTESSVSE